MKMSLIDPCYTLALKGAYIELTDSCNFQCQYCYNSSGGSKATFLNKETVKMIIDEVAKTDFPGVVFSGGEPFLHPEILEIIDYALNCDVKPTIITNGSLLDMDRIVQLSDKALTLQLTFDGICAFTHGKTRGEKNYYHLLDILKVYNEAGKSSRLNIRYNINRYNHAEVEDFIKLLLENGIKKATFAFLHKSGRGMDFDGTLDWKTDSVLVYEILTKYRIIKEKYKGMFDFEYGELDKAFGCAYFASGEIEFVPRIASDGNVYPCQIFAGEENSLGNVYEYKIAPLSQISCSERCMNVIEWIRCREGRINAKCQKCPMNGYCLGGCPAVAYNLNGTIDSNDEQCFFLKYSLKQRLLNENSESCINGVPTNKNCLE